MFVSTALIATLYLLEGNLAQETTISGVQRAFTDSKLVPDVLSSFNPTALLNIVFRDPTTNQSLKVTPGQNLTIDGK